jgi:putative ABC transport system substrate-binding protein
MTALNLLKRYTRAIPLCISLLFPNMGEADDSKNHKTIGITQIVEHPSLNAIREGILEELKKQGLQEGKNLTVVYESAQGNPTIAAQIATKFQSLPLDVVIPISTPSAQTIVHHIKTTPIVFAAITDPLGAKIVSSLEHPEGNVTGVTDTPPLVEQLSFIEGCLPHLTNLGVMYNPGEANSVAMLEALMPLAKAKKITLIPGAASKSSEVQATARSLIGKVDAIFVGNDNTVISGLEPLVKIALSSKVPLFVSDPDSVERGALAAYAYDQRQMGRQVGTMVARVLKGENVKDMPVERAKDLKFSLNPKTAEMIKVTCKIAQ